MRSAAAVARQTHRLTHRLAAWRLLALPRLLIRAARLVAHLREAHTEDVRALEDRLAAETRVRMRLRVCRRTSPLLPPQRASSLSRAARESQEALRREGESRRRTEQMLRAYKDEVGLSLLAGAGGEKSKYDGALT